ncbi:MAG: hypothetical protein QW067_08925 [Thermofilaceae archaeon]
MDEVKVPEYEKTLTHRSKYPGISGLLEDVLILTAYDEILS